MIRLLNSFNTVFTYGLAVLSLTSLPLLADTVETSDGSVLMGKIQSVSDGKLVLQTEFAGKLEIPLTQVTHFETEDEVIVRMLDGDTLTARVEPAETEDTIRIEGSQARIEAYPTDIQSIWMPGERDPAVVAAEEAAKAQQRHWEMEIGADIRGKRGNSQRSSIAGAVEAKLVGPRDELLLYGSYETARDDGELSANETIAGVEFTSYFSGKWGWFLRSELEQDEFENIQYRSTTSGGLSYRIVNDNLMQWTTRAGFGYRFESFDQVDPGDEGSVQGASLNWGSRFEWQFAEWGRLKTNATALAPADNFNDIRITLDTGLEFPLARSDLWKLQVGFRNDYDNEPDGNLRKLDTTYYTRLIMSFD